MASAAEQLARNLSFSTFSKAKALQQRIWFTLGALLVYRLGTFIPVPGIDPDAFRATFEQSQQGIPLLQLAGGDPPGGDDVCKVPSVAEERGRPAVRARDRYLP